MKTIVCKFGGSSVADAGQIRKVKAIAESNPERKFIVVSAPGKRNDKDIKITDLLYRCYSIAEKKEDFSEVLGMIKDRYASIIKDLQIEFDLDAEFALIEESLKTNPREDYAASRGEYLNARIIARYFGYDFLDPKDFFVFDDEDELMEEETYKKTAEALTNANRSVIAGFYGSRPNGEIVTFDRGGSDITGSVIAKAIHADMYENWTDVSGILRADPRIVENPETIDFITYKELRELSSMGFSVFHEDAVLPVKEAEIPINIRNTNRPEDPGTLIVPELPEDYVLRDMTGVAGKMSFVSMQIQKGRMSKEKDFSYKVMDLFEDEDVWIQHISKGVDTISLILDGEEYEEHRNVLMQRLYDELKPDVITVEENLSLIAIIRDRLSYTKGVAAKVFETLYEHDIDVRMIEHGSSYLNIIFAVQDKDYKKAIQAIYYGLIY